MIISSKRKSKATPENYLTLIYNYIYRRRVQLDPKDKFQGFLVVTIISFFDSLIKGRNETKLGSARKGGRMK